MIDFILNRIAKDGYRNTKKKNKTKQKRRFGDDLAEIYGYNLVSGINSDLMF